MKKLLLIFITLLMFNMMFAQHEKYIAFCAKEEGSVGHAFISLGREVPKSLMTIHDGTWGLYPRKRIKGLRSFITGEVPGEIRDDFLTQKDHVFVVTVTDAEYQMALQTLELWRQKNYRLLKNDCLSFLIEMANILNGRIEIPERSGFDNLPAQYLKELIVQNQQKE